MRHHIHNTWTGIVILLGPERAMRRHVLAAIRA